MSFQKLLTNNTNTNTSLTKALKALNTSLLKKINSPNFKPLEKVNLKLILIKHKELPSLITLLLQIPLYKYNTKYYLTKDRVNTSITLYTPNFKNL
jgi:hypothetical protein